MVPVTHVWINGTVMAAVCDCCECNAANEAGESEPELLGVSFKLQTE